MRFEKWQALGNDYLVVERQALPFALSAAAVNTGLVDLYWRLGEYISRKLQAATWGEGVVDALARYIERHHPNLRGFTRRNLFRMRQFFEAYQGDAGSEFSDSSGPGIPAPPDDDD